METCEEEVKKQRFKLVPSEFMSFWTRHYYGQDRFFRIRWLCYAIFMLAISIRIVKILSLYKEPGYSTLKIHLYCGTFAQYMGGPLHFTELIAFFWSITVALMYLVCVCRPRKNFHWLTVFVYLDRDNVSDVPKDLNEKSLNLTPDYVRKLQHVARVAFTLSSQYISQIATGLPLIISVLFYLNYTTRDFIIFGIPWILVWTLWTYSGCLVVYWMPSYYFVYCYYVKLQFRCINTELKTMIAARKRGRPFGPRSEYRLRLLISRHNSVCEQISTTNRYWTRYLTILFFVYTLIICLLLFFLLAVTIPWYTYIQYCVVILSGHVTLLVIVNYAATIVWREGRDTGALLAMLVIRIDKQHIGNKLKIMSYMERLKTNQHGFRLMTGYRLTSLSFQEITESLVKYFILVVQNR